MSPLSIQLITREQLKQVMPQATDRNIELFEHPLNDAMVAMKINTAPRVAAFILLLKGSMLLRSILVTPMSLISMAGSRALDTIIKHLSSESESYLKCQYFKQVNSYY